MPLTASELVLFDGWAEPVVVAGAEGFIVYANPAVEKLLGWPHGGLVGEPLVSIMPARMRERHLAGMARFIETRRPRILGRRVRVPALRRDGREVDIELSISTLQVDGRREMFLATLHDRTGVVELEAQEEMLALLDALLARAPLGFAFVDRSLRYVRANEHLANVTGRPELGYIGRTVQEVHGPISGPELTAVYEQVLATGEPLIGVERSVYTPAHPGPPQQLITSHYPVIARDGSIVGVALIAQDVTAQKKAEAEREVLAERERRAQADAEAERRMLRSLFMQAPAAIAMLRGPECVYELSNPANNAAIDRDPTGLPARVAFPEPEAQEHVERLEHVYRTGQGEVHPELRFQLRTPTGTRELFANVSYVPWRDPDGSILGVLVFGFDITEQVRARERAMAAERRAR